MKLILSFFTLLLIIMQLHSELISLNNDGSTYPGAEIPASQAIIFAPGIVSTKADETSVFFSPDSSEVYFTRHHTKLMVIKKSEKGKWSTPSEVSFGGKYYSIGEADISPDGRYLYFNCRTNVPGAKVPLTLWRSERKGRNWGPATGMKPPVNNRTMHAVTIGTDGTIYACGLLKCTYSEGRYSNPTRLNIKGSHPFISRDNKYMIFDKRQPAGYSSDLYIMFRKTDNSWSKARNLGSTVNTKKRENNAVISPDGKYIFFSRNGDIYWAEKPF